MLIDFSLKGKKEIKTDRQKERDREEERDALDVIVPYRPASRKR